MRWLSSEILLLAFSISREWATAIPQHLVARAKRPLSSLTAASVSIRSVVARVTALAGQPKAEAILVAKPIQAVAA